MQRTCRSYRLPTSGLVRLHTNKLGVSGGSNVNSATADAKNWRRPGHAPSFLFELHQSHICSDDHLVSLPPSVVRACRDSSYVSVSGTCVDGAARLDIDNLSQQSVRDAPMTFRIVNDDRCGFGVEPDDDADSLAQMLFGETNGVADEEFLSLCSQWRRRRRVSALRPSAPARAVQGLAQ